MENKKKNKEKLLFEAFKLFAQSTYDRVTFDELEKATGLTRGAIAYHFKNKENLFVAVVEEYVFKRGSIIHIPIGSPDTNVLENFILNFIKHCKKETERVYNLGIVNFNHAYFNIENQGLFFYPNMIGKVLQWLNIESIVWESIISTSIKNNEIKGNIEAKRLASMFVRLYLGDCYIGIFSNRGQDLNQLEEDFMSLYSMVKANN